MSQDREILVSLENWVSPSRVCLWEGRPQRWVRDHQLWEGHRRVGSSSSSLQIIVKCPCGNRVFDCWEKISLSTYKWMCHHNDNDVIIHSWNPFWITDLKFCLIKSRYISNIPLRWLQFNCNEKENGLPVPACQEGIVWIWVTWPLIALVYNALETSLKQIKQTTIKQTTNIGWITL